MTQIIEYLINNFNEHPVITVTFIVFFLFAYGIFKIITTFIQKHIEKQSSIFYKFLSESRKNKIAKTKELRKELIRKLKTDNDTKVAFYFYENRLRSKYIHHLITTTLSFLAMIIIISPVLSNGINIENKLFLIFTSIGFYALAVINIFFAVYYKMYLRRIKSILNEFSIDIQSFILI